MRYEEEKREEKPEEGSDLAFLEEEITNLNNKARQIKGKADKILESLSIGTKCEAPCEGEEPKPKNRICKANSEVRDILNVLDDINTTLDNISNIVG